MKPDNDELQINEIWIWKKIDEVEEDEDESIAILTEHEGLTLVQIKAQIFVK